MNAEHWQKVKDLFDAALEIEPAKRERFLRRVCGDDVKLRGEVENLLDSFDSDADFMEKPAAWEVASLIVDQKGKLKSGQQFAHYEIVSQIGEGGMGEVYLAKDVKLNRRVALKVLPEHLTADRLRLQRFEHEARAASALNHPNIITIHEIGAENNIHFIAVEFVEGETLRQKISGENLKTAEILDIAAQVVSALSVAHGAGVIHRDIKPENIMIRPDLIVKLLDFGLAKLSEPPAVAGGFDADKKAEHTTQKFFRTKPGMIMGTVNYMSPEQATGGRVDRRTDLWSLGVVLYEMLSGNLPFSGKTVNHSLVAIMENEPPPLKNVSAEFERIVLKLLAKEPENRYQMAADLLADLRDLQKNPDAPDNEQAATQLVEKDTAFTKPKTTGSGVSYSTSSAEYIFTEIKRHKRGILLAALALILTSVAAFYFYNTARPKISSIAVLPFQNASGDDGLEYLADGLSENLINNLAQIGQIKVIAQSSAFRYKNKEIDPKEVGQTLGVEALLMGKITKSGDRLSIGVELINARDGSIIWNEKYNLDSPDAARDAQLVQNRIAVQTVKNLDINLTDIQDKQLTKYATQNAQAYQLYLNAALLKRKSSSTETIKKAIDYYNQAVALDPNFALAYVALANSYRFLAGSSNVEISSYSNRKKINEKMYQAIARAQELDADLPEVYTTLGGIKIHEFDFPAAERSYQHAIELSPNSPGAHSGYAGYLMIAGRGDEALTQIGLAEQLDPLNFNLKISEGRMLFAARRYDKAIPFLQTLVKTAPDNPMIHFNLAQSYTYKGMHREALAEHEKYRAIQGKYSDEFYLFALAKAGKIAEARQELEKLKKRESYSPAEFAVAYVALGEKQQALALLEKAFDERDPQLQFLKIEPGYDEIRSDPRFQELLQKVGF